MMCVAVDGATPMMHARAQGTFPRQAAKATRGVMAAMPGFDMDRVSTELLEHVFGFLGTEVAVMVLPRVCRRWKGICANMTLEEFDLSWAVCPRDGRGAGATLAALGSRGAQSAAVCAMAARVGGARRVYVARFNKGMTASYFTDAALDAVCRFRMLAELNMSSCPGITTVGMVPVSKLPGLTSLCLRGNGWVGDPTLEVVGRLGHLKTLKLGYCRLITDDGISHLANLRHLATLNLSNCCEITDEGVAHLAAKLQCLEELDLGHCCKITNMGVGHLRNPPPPRQALPESVQ